MGGVSIALLGTSLVIIPAIVVRLPSDYFMHERRMLPPWVERRPFVRYLVVGGKNMIGVVLILASIAGFLLPGLGVVTLIIGFVLLDFPGKFRVMKWLVGKPFIHRPLNWIRRRRGREPIQVK